MLGWSDGGITALIAAAQYTFLINKLVVWGSNAYVTEDDIKLYNGKVFFFDTYTNTIQYTLAKSSQLELDIVISTNY